MDALAAGTSFITNGPFLEFRVNGKNLGDTIALQKAATVEVVGRGIGRVDFKQIELIHNGKVIQSAQSQPVSGHFKAELKRKLNITSPGWLALRTPPQFVKQDPELQTRAPMNELGRELFAHTSPIYVEVAGNGIFDKKIARELLAKMRSNRQAILDQAKQIKGVGDKRTETKLDALALARVLDVYEDGIETLRAKLEKL